MNDGYGIHYSYQSCEEISDSCGIHCSNCEAEAQAIEASLNHISNAFTEERNLKSDMVSDAKFVLQALESRKLDNITIRNRLFYC